MTLSAQQLHTLVNDTAEAWTLDKFGTTRSQDAREYSQRAYAAMLPKVNEDMSEAEALNTCRKTMESHA